MASTYLKQFRSPASRHRIVSIHCVKMPLITRLFESGGGNRTSCALCQLIRQKEAEAYPAYHSTPSSYPSDFRHEHGVVVSRSGVDPRGCHLGADQWGNRREEAHGACRWEESRLEALRARGLAQRRPGQGRRWRRSACWTGYVAIVLDWELGYIFLSSVVIGSWLMTEIWTRKCRGLYRFLEALK